MKKRGSDKYETCNCKETVEHVLIGCRKRRTEGQGGRNGRGLEHERSVTQGGQTIIGSKGFS